MREMGSRVINGSSERDGRTERYEGYIDKSGGREKNEGADKGMGRSQKDELDTDRDGGRERWVGRGSKGNKDKERGRDEAESKRKMWVYTEQ